MALGFKDEEVGGAVVLRKIDTFDPTTGAPRSFNRGDKISREGFLKWSPANRRALAEAGYIHVHLLDASPKERFIVQVSPGKFDVIERKLLDAGPLTREAAEKLAAKEEQAND
jgi:hypothetical protein